MKKLFIALVAILTIALFSCNNSTKVLSPGSNDFVFTASCDTSITVQVPVTGSINLCSGGKSQYKKVLSYKDSVIHLVKGQIITISNDEMNGKGWYYFPDGLKTTDQSVVDKTSNTSDFNWLPGWFKKLLAFLFWVLIIGLFLWLLIWLIREFLNWLNNPTRRSTTSEQHTTENQVVTNPVQRPTPPVPATAEEITAMAALATVIKDGGGGNASKGDMLININGIQPPLVQITNSGSNSKSGDIMMVIADTVVNEAEDAKEAK